MQVYQSTIDRAINVSLKMVKPVLSAIEEEEKEREHATSRNQGFSCEVVDS